MTETEPTTTTPSQFVDIERGNYVAVNPLQSDSETNSSRTSNEQEQAQEREREPEVHLGTLQEAELVPMGTTAVPVDDEPQPRHTTLKVILATVEKTYIHIPLIVLSIYFMAVDHTCMDIHVSAVGGLSLRNYMTGAVISEIIYVIVTAFMLLYTKSISHDEAVKYNKEFVNYSPTIVWCLFDIIWSIIGAIIYFGYLYPHDNCATSLNTYLFVSFVSSYTINTCVLSYKYYWNIKRIILCGFSCFDCVYDLLCALCICLTNIS